ncbi:MAG: hypothetical protein V1898_03515 [Patescibacteria group bacterium]
MTPYEDDKIKSKPTRIHDSTTKDGTERRFGQAEPVRPPLPETLRPTAAAAAETLEHAAAIADGVPKDAGMFAIPEDLTESEDVDDGLLFETTFLSPNEARPLQAGVASQREREDEPATDPNIEEKVNESEETQADAEQPVAERARDARQAIGDKLIKVLSLLEGDNLNSVISQIEQNKPDFWAGLHGRGREVKDKLKRFGGAKRMIKNIIRRLYETVIEPRNEPSTDAHLSVININLFDDQSIIAFTEKITQLEEALNSLITSPTNTAEGGESTTEQSSAQIPATVDYTEVIAKILDSAGTIHEAEDFIKREKFYREQAFVYLYDGRHDSRTGTCFHSSCNFRTDINYDVRVRDWHNAAQRESQHWCLFSNYELQASDNYDYRLEAFNLNKLFEVYGHEKIHALAERIFDRFHNSAKYFHDGQEAADPFLRSPGWVYKELVKHFGELQTSKKADPATARADELPSIEELFSEQVQQQMVDRALGQEVYNSRTHYGLDADLKKLEGHENYTAISAQFREANDGQDISAHGVILQELGKLVGEASQEVYIGKQLQGLIDFLQDDYKLTRLAQAIEKKAKGGFLGRFNKNQARILETIKKEGGAMIMLRNLKKSLLEVQEKMKQLNRAETNDFAGNIAELKKAIGAMDASDTEIKKSLIVVVDNLEYLQTLNEKTKKQKALAELPPDNHKYSISESRLPSSDKKPPAFAVKMRDSLDRNIKCYYGEGGDREQIGIDFTSRAKQLIKQYEKTQPKIKENRIAFVQKRKEKASDLYDATYTQLLEEENSLMRAIDGHFADITFQTGLYHADHMGLVMKQMENSQRRLQEVHRKWQALAKFDIESPEPEPDQETDEVKKRERFESLFKQTVASPLEGDNEDRRDVAEELRRIVVVSREQAAYIAREKDKIYEQEKAGRLTRGQAKKAIDSLDRSVFTTIDLEIRYKDVLERAYSHLPAEKRKCAVEAEMAYLKGVIQQTNSDVEQEIMSQSKMYRAKKKLGIISGEVASGAWRLAKKPFGFADRVIDAGLVSGGVKAWGVKEAIKRSGAKFEDSARKMLSEQGPVVQEKIGNALIKAIDRLAEYLKRKPAENIGNEEGAETEPSTESEQPKNEGDNSEPQA